MNSVHPHWLTTPETLSTTYAVEIVPTILRPYVTAYVCMCWGAGILLSSGVVRAVLTIPGDLAWRLPFVSFHSAEDILLYMANVIQGAPMGLADPVAHRNIPRPGIAVVSSQTRCDRPGKEELASTGT